MLIEDDNAKIKNNIDILFFLHTLTEKILVDELTSRRVNKLISPPAHVSPPSEGPGEASPFC